jgi:hypothetical protein
MAEIPMNILLRAAQLILDVNKIQSAAAVKLYFKLGFYKKLYTACGIPGEVAARLEAKLLAEIHRGVAEQHALASRWISGDIAITQVADDCAKWFSAYLEHCSVSGPERQSVTWKGARASTSPRLSFTTAVQAPAPRAVRVNAQVRQRGSAPMARVMFPRLAPPSAGSNETVISEGTRSLFSTSTNA